MIRINKKLALAASLTTVVVGISTGVAFASGPEPTPADDNINPANTAFTATNTTNSINNTANIQFSGTVNGLSVTVTCKNSSISGTTPVSGLGPVNINDPSFTNCSDNVFGSDTVTTNHTNGPWQVTFCDQSNDEGIVIGTTTDEPPGHGGHAGDPHCSTTSTGDALKVTIPQNGAKFVAAGGFCTITAAPSGAATIIGAYDDVNTVTFNGASFPVSGSGCTASSSKITGAYKSNVNFQDVSS